MILFFKAFENGICATIQDSQDLSPSYQKNIALFRKYTRLGFCSRKIIKTWLIDYQAVTTIVYCLSFWSRKIRKAEDNPWLAQSSPIRQMLSQRMAYKTRLKRLLPAKSVVFLIRSKLKSRCLLPVRSQLAGTTIISRLLPIVH